MTVTRHCNVCCSLFRKWTLNHDPDENEINRTITLLHSAKQSDRYQESRTLSTETRGRNGTGAIVHHRLEFIRR